jgi:hypothetical protein
MKNIDFLPEIYHERMALRQARVWWGIVVLIFGAAIASTATAQYLLKRSIQRQYDDLAPEFVAAQEQVKRLGQAQAENRTAGQWAALITYLEQPWPRSQLVAEAIRPLPPDIRLTELIVGEEDLARPATEETGPRRRGPAANAHAKPLAPAVADFEELRKAHDFKRPVIEITGTVHDVSLVHEYVDVLGRSPLVGQARIKSLESAATTVLEQPTSFTVRLVFRASHGQPEADPATGADAMKVVQGGAGR